MNIDWLDGVWCIFLGYILLARVWSSVDVYVRLLHVLLIQWVDASKIGGDQTRFQECELLKIEDILPFFPDFVVIDSFKREICVSLEEYNGKIESLRKEMEDYTLSTEAVQVV